LHRREVTTDGNAPARSGRLLAPFLPPFAEAFKRDIPDADVRFFDTGHFALETHCDEIAAAIRNFLSRSK
jgi:pimeloyl-ACP methyl ester carboxylesterase